MENYSAGPASSTVNSGKYVWISIKSGFLYWAQHWCILTHHPPKFKDFCLKIKKNSRGKSPTPDIFFGPQSQNPTHLSAYLLRKGWKVNLFLALQFSGGSKKSIWSMTREQINYYTTQFFCLQSDPNGVIPGTEAKEFFERSKLPINDLRKIWQLSDVSQVLLFSI